MTRKVVATLPAITGDLIEIGEIELRHALESHFPMLPADILLELVERILKEPTKVFMQKKTHLYHLFYRLDNGKYLVVIIKKLQTGNYFSSIYPTGEKIRNIHKNLKEIKL